jgi:hypothetical protein
MEGVKKVLTMMFNQLMKRILSLSSKLSNRALACSFALLAGTLALLPVYRMTESTWAGYAGAASFLLAVGFCAVALGAQTVSQTVRVTSGIRTMFGKDKEASLFRLLKNQTCLRASSVNFHTRNNARACRRSSHPVFARSSDGGSSDNSGESDSGDPPGHPHLLTSPTLFSCNARKQNSFSCIQRFPRWFGCWRVSCSRRSFGKWTS